MSDEARVKGTGLRSSIDWISDNYGEDTWQKILSLLSAEEQGKAKNVVAPLMYPVALADKIWRGFVDNCCPKDHKAREEAFRKMGRYIANISIYERIALLYIELTSQHSPAFQRCVCVTLF